MSTPTEWTWHEDPPGIGWYAILKCWDPEEGTFSEAFFVESLPLEWPHDSGLLAHAGPFSTEEEAKAWAWAHDPE